MANNPFRLIQNNNYKTYHQWVQRNSREIESNIKNEIDRNFLAWCETSRQAVEDFSTGLMNEEDCSRHIAVPEVSVRSPLLAEKNADRRAREGIV